MSWLVTGGAGYIGAHVVRAFAEQGLSPVVIDDLSSGHRDFVPASVPFVEGTILDEELLVKTMTEHDVTGVVHVAGYKYAGVSVQRPLHTYEQNVTATARLLSAMETCSVDAIVFSSSAATYGTPVHRDRHRGESHVAGVAVRRVEADRRVAAARSGEGQGASPHLPALLQRGRLRVTRPARHQPAQPLPAGARRHRRGAYAADQRR